jgi:DNA gyrase/topoisomerase IV subunit A
MAKKMLEISASELVRTSMETYAKEVIEDRSLPDFRDGLKISQRRILYYMWSEGITSDGNFKASANVIGGVLGKLHPHGDMAGYQTLVTLNNNTVSPVWGDGDGWGSLHTEASAMRYTKTKLSSFGDLFCNDIPIAHFIPNYSGDWKEPIVIPAPIPYALLAGTSGIAVAVATSIPSHNLTELVSTFLTILNGEQDIDKLVGTTLLAPESKTGGVVISTLDELREVYQAGKGKVRWRCDYDIVYDKKDDSWSLVVTGIPEAFALDSWLNKMKQHAQNGMIQIENESCANDPIRYVVTFNNVAFFHDVIEPSLYCTDNYNFNLIAKAGENATDMSLHHHTFLSWVDAWLTWREEVEVKIVQDRISKLEHDLIRESAKQWATAHIDAIVDTIKKSKNPQADLKTTFKLNDIQAKVIAEMPLQSISRLSQEKLSKSVAILQEEVAKDYQRLLQPKKLIEATLKSLLQHDKKGRVAKFDYGDSKGQKTNKALRKSEGKPNYWAIETNRPKILHQIGSELSLRKRVLNPYLNLVNAQTGLVTVSEKGEIKRWGLSDLAEKDHSCSYVNILSPESQLLVLSLNNGLWGTFWMEQKVSSWTTKLLHSGEDKILSAVGVTRGDILWVHSTNLVESVFCDWEPFSRSNKSGWKGKGGKEIRLFVIPKGYSLVIDSKMVRYSFSDLVRPSKDITQRFLKAKFYYVFNPKDDKKPLLCIAQDGTRSIMTGAEIAHSSLDLIQTYPL